MILRIGPACALTAITTALAFTSIMVTRNAQLFDFAVLGGLGTLLAFVVTISTVAILAIFMRPSVGAAPRFTGVFAQHLSRISLAAPKTFIVLAVCCWCVLFMAFSKPKLGSRFIKICPQEAQPYK